MLVGNGCWGGDEHHVQCNGPHSERNDVDLYHGKGLVSTRLYRQIKAACPASGLDSDVNPACSKLLDMASRQAGPHNVYDIYDNCPRTKAYLAEQGGRPMRWLLHQLRARFDEGVSLPAAAEANATLLGGGYEWSCGDTYPPGLVSPWFTRPEVQKALHLNAPGLSAFDYTTSGPASITLYPELIKQLRVMIYNGDADSCVPYIGNEEWIDGLAEQGLLAEAEAWRPWFTERVPSMPAGYVTTYNVTDSSQQLTFLTIRLAGHMVPMFQPNPALTFFRRFLAAQPQ
jgi:hypothetical protein